MALLLPAPGCTGPLLSSLSLRLHTAPEARVFGPADATTPASFALSATGPDGLPRHMESDDGLFSLLALSPGAWTLRASAADSEGIRLYEGLLEVHIYPGEQAVREMALYPVGGRGTLTGTVSWPEGALQDPRIALEIRGIDPDEEPQVLELAGSDPRESVVVFGPVELDAGYYLVTTRLLEADRALAGRTDAARVAAGFETRFATSFEQTGDAFFGTVSLQVLLPDLAPLAIDLDLPDLPLFPGETARVLARPGPARDWDASDSNIDVRWFLDAISVVPAPGDAVNAAVVRGGSTRLDVVVASRGRVGIAGVYLDEASPPARLGRYGYRRDFLRSRDGIPALGGARALAVSEDGHRVAVAGYDSDRIAVFARSGETGGHRLAAIIDDHVLDGVSDLVYRRVGGTEVPLLVAAGYRSGTLAAFREEPVGEGYTRAFETTESGVGPVALAADPLDSAVFAVADYHADRVRMFRLTSDGLDLLRTIDSSAGDHLDGPRDLVLDAAGTLFVAAERGDAVLVFEAGSSGPPDQVFVDGYGGVDSLNGAGQLLLHAVGDSGATELIVTSYYDHSVTVFRRSAPEAPFGRSQVFRSPDFPGLRYPRGLAGGSDGSVFVAGGGDDTLVLFSRDGSNTLVYAGTLDTQMSALDGPRAIALGRGEELYVASDPADSLSILAPME